MLQIVYASAATVPFGQSDLIELLKIARQKNSAVDISGMLLYNAGSFLQVLEGPDENVDALYAKIQKDTRHARFLLLSRKAIQEREFEKWSMGFVNATRVDIKVEGFVDYVGRLKSMTLDSTIACKMLKRFQEGAWRRSEYGCF
jgi:uncharacterized Fe-S cluster-containing MiaB family protein